MKLYNFERIQKLAISPETAWAFFSDPCKLKEITPPSLHLEPTSDWPETMYPGLLITYRVRPLFGIPIDWVTEITAVDSPAMFIDEQRFGPYRFWHHRHFFRSVPGGTEVRDLISYALRFDPISRPANIIIVKNKLNMIFDYRREVLSRKFGEIK
jgi:ligand-binding SRPBCC domain-containing protein